MSLSPAGIQQRLSMLCIASTPRSSRMILRARGFNSTPRAMRLSIRKTTTPNRFSTIRSATKPINSCSSFASLLIHRSPLHEVGNSMDVKAAVAWRAGEPLALETVQLEGPRAGEVLIEIKATGICHTDEFTRSGADPEGLFPVIFGHEGAGIVVDVGPGVTTLKKGDHVIPLYIPECRQCKSCLSRKTNLCTSIRATQGKGLMPDGTSRFSLDGQKIHHYMGCSTFANYTVMPEIALAKVRDDAPFDKICYIG